ncbi:MAG TPA: succinate dehydrogenase cytochrome b558 subunit [Verrucomicrobiae bacterium]|nr:succinate dehydrogenase cytochrome b558 subunit [Verrucomicrobiae bacterium]
MSSKFHFLIRRVHSLMGLLPIGIFLAFHLTLNILATQSVERYEKVINTMRETPGIVLLEVVVIFLPILFHAVYGIIVVYGGGVNTLRYTYFRNWYYVLQRATGLLALLFVFYHVYALRVDGETAKATVSALTDFVKTPFGLIFYIVGVLSAIFHFANGLWAFLITWGITIGPRSQKISTWACGGVFVILSVVALKTLVQLMA